MNKIFLLQLLITFLTGSLWIYFTVIAGLRFGSKIGGFIGGLPSTALLSFFFIGYTQSPEMASAATAVFPVALSISGLFLAVYASLVRRGFIPALIAGLCFWFLLSTGIFFLRLENFLSVLLIYAAITLAAYIILEKYLKIRSVSQERRGNPEKYLIVRSLFGGAIVMLTVLVAKTVGPFTGGIFAAFPAMFISTLTISYKVNGIEFSRALTKPLMVTGMITITVYAIAIRYLYLSTGIYLGTVLGILISSFSAYITFRLILPRLI